MEGFKADRREYQRLYRKTKLDSDLESKQINSVTDVSSNDLNITVHPYVNSFSKYCIICKKWKFTEDQ